MASQLGKIRSILFPSYTGSAINCNMLPFIMGQLDSIPPLQRIYADIIRACPIPASEYGKVGYLSIDESPVIPGQSHRRGGIHTEGHPCSSWGGWGYGIGLYMASTVPNSCQAWDHYVDRPGPMGDCEHLRDTLDSPIRMEADTLYWMTDRCPHESLPIPDGVERRQWFRLVTSKLDMWYPEHNTFNELGVVPPASCRIIEGNKFAS